MCTVWIMIADDHAIVRRGARRDIVGFYVSADKLSPGFLRTGDSLTPIDIPGAA